MNDGKPVGKVITEAECLVRHNNIVVKHTKLCATVKQHGEWMDNMDKEIHGGNSKPGLHDEMVRIRVSMKFALALLVGIAFAVAAQVVGGVFNGK